MRRFLKILAIGVASLILLSAIVLLIARQISKLPDEQFTPGGLRRSTSVYVPMRDSVEIAVSILLPADWQSEEKLPVLMRTARYWREPKIGWTARSLVGLHLLAPEDILDKQVLYFSDRRFVVILADARGTGASGGR